VIRVADIRGIDVSSEDLTIRTVLESKLRERLISHRSLLLEKSGGGEQKPVGRAVRCITINFDAICSNFMAKIDCGDTVDPSFMAYALDSLYRCGVNNACIQQTTGIQNLRVLDYLNSKIAFPCLSEQSLIASYLDACCSAIQVAVAAKCDQLRTLDALQRSKLHYAFATLSSVEDERIKDIAIKIGSGVTPEGGALAYLNDGIPLIRSQNVHFDGLRLEDVACISPEIHAQMSNSQIQARDVLLNITGASIGRCTFVPDEFGEGNVNQHVCIIRPGPKVDHRFLTAFLASPIGQDQILSTFTGASRQGLSHKELGLIRIPLPDVQTQHETVELIGREETKHRQLRGVIKHQIKTLLDYSKSLIHECVTGKRRITESDVARVVNSKEV
jgi:type I restriction enzyme S subunit